MALPLARNPNAYPGTLPGFNPGHIASSARVRYSGVGRGGSFLNLLSGKPPTPVTAGAATAVMSAVGPATNCNANGSAFTTPGLIETPTAFTAAAIVTPLSTSTSFGPIFVTGGFSNPDLGLELNAGAFGVWSGGTNSAVVGAPAYAINTPYFLAFSGYNSASSGNLYLVEVVLNLKTGALFSGSANGTNTFGTFSSAVYNVGGWSTGSFQSQSLVSAVMFSVDATPLTALRQWAQSPWDFWYPPKARQTMFFVKGGVASAAAAPRVMVMA